MPKKFATAEEAWRPALAIAIICLLAFEFFGPLRVARNWIEDLRVATLALAPEQNDEIVVLAITEETLAKFPYRAPINRGFLADVVDALGAHKNIRALGIDLLFDQPTTAEEDQRLRQTLRDANFPVVVAVGEEQASLTPAQLAFQREYLDGITIGSAILRSQDGVVRNYWPTAPGGKNATFARVLAEVAGAQAPQQAEAILFHMKSDEGVAPIAVFPAHSATLLPPAWLQGKIVLIGSDLPHQDRHRTPLSVLGTEYETTPGVLVHAQMLAQMLGGQRPPKSSLFTNVVTVLLAALAGLFGPLLPVSSKRRVLLCFGIVPLYWVLVFMRPLYWNFPLPVLEPVVVYILTTSLSMSLDRRRQRREKQFMHNALVHYVAESVVQDLLAHPDKLRLGGERREMSFLFTDVASFAELAEEINPEQLVSLMTRYLQGMIELVKRRGGTVGRLTGDGLLVFFNAPQQQSDHCRRAVDCALDMDGYCQNFRDALARQNIDFGMTRIGVHSGPAVVGNVGGAERFEYTAYGNSINTASRLESCNRYLGTRVCLSSASIGEHPEKLFRPVANVKLKGIELPVDVYTFWGTEDDDQKSKCRDVYNKLSDTSSGARPMLEDLARELPQDGLTRLYLARLEAGEPPLEIVMKEK